MMIWRPTRLSTRRRREEMTENKKVLQRRIRNKKNVTVKNLA